MCLYRSGNQTAWGQILAPSPTDGILGKLCPVSQRQAPCLYHGHDDSTYLTELAHCGLNERPHAKALSTVSGIQMLNKYSVLPSPSSSISSAFSHGGPEAGHPVSDPVVSTRSMDVFLSVERIEILSARDPG